MLSNPANGMDVTNGQIVFTSPDNAREAHALMSRTLATGSGTGFAPAGAVTLRRATGLPLTLIAVPLPGTQDRLVQLAAMTHRPVVALLICDPDRAVGLPDHLLRTVFGFTPAECRLAQALAAGQSPGEYADSAGIGIRTVRTHISRLLAKTGARNRIELMRILGGVPFAFEAST